jgi:SAM-dependent methyltransferase
MLRRWLAHPLTRSVPIDDPKTTALRRQIIRSKPFLEKIYDHWYRQIAVAVPEGPGRVLELGSGAGFLREYIPGLITSEVFFLNDVDCVLDGTALPFANGSLRAIVLVDVLHHIADIRAFFREATRCIRPSGALVMIEPWVTPWSKFVYRRFHHEPFDARTHTWEFAASGPLSSANGALPWILFERDRRQFEQEFPEWNIREIVPQNSFSYLASGGVSLRSLSPGWTYPIWRGVESTLQPWMRWLAMFARIQLTRM